MYPTHNSLVILLWNADGVSSRRDELDYTLHDRRVDVALLTETHLTDNSYLGIKDYTTYRTDHPDNRAQGGTAILIRSNLSHFLHAQVSSRRLMSTSITLDTSLFKLTVAAVYCPPNSNITSQEFLSFFQSLGPSFIAGGDYNSKHPCWGCRVDNPRGRILLNTLSSTSYNVTAPNSYTYWPKSPHRLPDLLDFFITSQIQPSRTDVFAFHDLSSDHSPVIFTLETQPIEKPKKPSLITGPINWDTFKQYITDSIDLTIPLKTKQDLDRAVQDITNVIQQAARTATLPAPPPKHKDRLNLPLHIRSLITERRRARAAWNRTRYPSDKHHFNVLTRRLKRALHMHRSDVYEQFTTNLTTTDKSLWHCTRRILNYKEIPSPLRKDRSSWAKSDQEKADLFAEHLTTVYTPHPNIMDQEHTDMIEQELDIPLQLSPPPKPISPAEIKYIIKHLPRNKAPGYDLITPTILRHLPQKAIVFLTSIFNSVLRTTYFPTILKFSLITMIPKPNKPKHLASSYRPISLLPFIAKVLEKLLLKRLLPILESSDIIPPHQFGFRHQHSTTQQLHRIVDAIASSLEQKQYCSGVFLDEAQAFDRVWHRGLLWKLKRVLPHTLYLILRSYLSDRYCRVRQGAALSPYFLVKAGVPQGSILGPILYTVYTANLPTHPETLLATFADDKAILSQHPDPQIASSHLQQHLSSIENWCQKWRIKINPTKSVHTTFTLRRNTCPPVLFNDTPLPTTDRVRYLGLYIDKRLTWNPHTRLKRQEMKRRFKLLQRLLDQRSKLSTQNKLTIYKTILRPMWTYGCELWGSAKQSNIYRFQSLQSIILRKIVNAPFYVSNLTIHNDLRIPFVHDLVQSRYIKFHNSLLFHPNPLVQSLSSLTIPGNPVRRLRRRWPRDHLLH